MKSDKTQHIRLLIFLIVLIFCGSIFWVWWRDGISPVNGENTVPELFIIQKGEGVKSIAARLSQQNLIRSSTAFFILVKLDGIETQLQAGDYRLNQSMDARSIARELTHGTSDVWVTIPEGWRKEEISMKLARELDIPESEFLKIAEEGYLFPDTYLVPRDATSGAVLDLFYANFHSKITDSMKSEMMQSGLSFTEALVLASLVEREGKNNEDRPVIAGILYNRLKLKMPLQVDATLQYALGYQSAEKNWWKKNLTAQDKLVDSPYNTYINVGLPPSPISNPGLDALKAVTKPVNTEYLYYLHDPKGNVHYAETLNQHTANIAAYLR